MSSRRTLARIRKNNAMSLFLLTFYRDRRHETTVETIDDRSVALERLFAAEQNARFHPEVEVVLLTATDEDDLRQTHARYFESVDELLAV